MLTRVVDFNEDVPVVNLFGNSSTTFTPSDGYPLSIAKVDSEDDEVVINDTESRFNILDEDDNVVIEDAFVVDGQLRVTNDEGKTTGLVVREPGTYYVEEVVAPTGYELSTDRIQVTVDADGSSQQVTFPNVPAEEPPKPEIDVIKNDEGDDVHEVQAGEHDVTVTITNNGNEALENFEFTDTTEEGQDVVWNDEDLARLDELVLEVGDSYTVNGTVQVAAGETHRDNVVVNADGVISGEPVEDEDPTTYVADPTYAIGDYVWIDSNRDGLQDDDESPLRGVTVVLYDGDGNVVVNEDGNEQRTTTDDAGRYIFDNLPAGDYQVGFELTEEQERQYFFTTYTQGDEAADDSNAGEQGRSEVFTLGEDSPLVDNENYEYNTVEASAGIDPTWDAGVIERTYAIGDYVWIDENRDGIQDDEESPLDGVTVVLYNGEGEELDRTTTNDDGRYIFDDLPAGEYQVGFELTEEQERLYNFSNPVEGEDAAEDSDAGSNGRSEVFPLGPDSPLTSDDDYDYFEVEASEGIDPTWDAGVQLKPYAIGDYVWIDANNNGIQDADEEPLPDVTVVLYNDEGVEIDRTTTDENGRYIFDTLNAGECHVRFILTDEQAEIYEFTDYREGSDTQVDSNAGYSGFSATITLGPDNQFLTLNEDYAYGTVIAPFGIDPTWDAGVVLIPGDAPTDPVDPTDPSEPADPSAPIEPTEPVGPSEPTVPTDPGADTSGDKAGGLSKTGANLALLFGALGLILLLTGGVLYARHRKGNEA